MRGGGARRWTGVRNHVEHVLLLSERLTAEGAS